MLEQGLVDLSQALENGSIGRDMFTQSNKGPDHKDTHVDRSFAISGFKESGTSRLFVTVMDLAIEPWELTKSVNESYADG